MARHRVRVRLARSLRSIVVAALATGTGTALFEWNLGRNLVVPLGLVALAPLIVYVVLALAAMPGEPAARRLTWALAACGVNAVLGLATSVSLALTHPLSIEGAVARAFGGFAPAPLIHLVAAPLVLLVWRGPLTTSRRRVPRGERSAAGPRSAPAPLGSPNWDAVLRPSSVTWNAGHGAGPAAFERARPKHDEPESEPAVAAAPPEPPPPSVPTPAPTFVPAPPVVASPVAKAPKAAAAGASVKSVEQARPPAVDEPVVRIAFDRIAAQFPADVFTLAPARLGESLREPHTLVVPQRLVLPQLHQGAVEIAWTLIEDQFPELALAMPASEVRRRYPDWVVALPMDEVVRQIPPDLFHLAAPAADISAIGEFPAPFEPGPPAPVVEPEPPTVIMSAPPPAAPAPPAPPAAPPAAVSVDARIVARTSPPKSPPPAAPPPSPKTPKSTIRPAAAVAAPAAGESHDEEFGALARALAVPLAPLGALEWHARPIAGRLLVCFVAPGLPRAAVEALGVRGHALLERLAGWPVDQVTVRTSRVACILVPVTSGTLVVGVRRGGPVAFAEVLAARARAGGGRALRTPVAAAGLGAASLTPAVEGTGHGRVGEAARALGVFGSIVSTVTTSDGGAPVYLFAASADAAVAGAARAVHDTLIAGHDEAGLGHLDSVVLRHGRERAIVRGLRGASGAPALLAAAGEVTLTGRAQRAAARAATLLEAR
ncbi:MAG: hypothetical protein E6K82_16645 [Candidatus Rokuibacteriota bacterium]|nr:MAG: hypothetical protein E6K82_16645 [Candidatus Rokubacteria bacterium]